VLIERLDQALDARGDVSTPVGFPELS
jgi:hypothetical protein